MNRHSAFLKHVVVLTFVLLTPLCPVSADEAPPGYVKATPPVSVKIDAKATETRIQISRDALNQLLGVKEKRDDGSVGFMADPNRTLGAGLAMSLALVLGGLYLARKRVGRAVLSPMVILALVGVLCASSVALADKAPSTPIAVPNRAHSTLVATDGAAAELTVNPMVLRLLKKRAAASGN